MGSLGGAFLASLLIGAIQTYSVAMDYSFVDLFAKIGIHLGPDAPLAALWNLTISQTGPVLPYLLMVLMLIFRPKGLMGTRES